LYEGVAICKVHLRIFSYYY